MRRPLLMGSLLLLASVAAHAQSALDVSMLTAHDLDAQLAERRAELETERAEKTAVEQELLALPELEQALEGALERDVRALYRLRRGGLLPMASGLESLMSHASRVAHFERMTRRTLAQLQQSRENTARLSAEVAAIEAKIAMSEERVDELQRQKVSLEREAAVAQAVETPLPPAPVSNDPVYGLTLVGDSPAPRNARFSRQRGQLALPVSGAAGIQNADTLAGEPLALTFEAKPGASVRAVADGRVVLAEPRDGHGLLVIVDHGDRYRTLYGGLSSSDVQVGDAISKSARIGTAGSQSVYFELRRGQRSEDARSWLGL